MWPVCEFVLYLIWLIRVTVMLGSYVWTVLTLKPRHTHTSARTHIQTKSILCIGYLKRCLHAHLSSCTFHIERLNFHAMLLLFCFLLGRRDRRLYDSWLRTYYGKMMYGAKRWKMYAPSLQRWKQRATQICRHSKSIGIISCTKPWNTNIWLVFVTWAIVCQTFTLILCSGNRKFNIAQQWRRFDFCITHSWDVSSSAHSRSKDFRIIHRPFSVSWLTCKLLRLLIVVAGVGVSCYGYCYSNLTWPFPWTWCVCVCMWVECLCRFLLDRMFIFSPFRLSFICRPSFSLLLPLSRRTSS